MPIHIFALEFIKKTINMDQLHFLVVKKKAQFKIKTQIGPFTCNARSTRQEVDAILKQMNFKHSFTWSYNPFGIISKLRVEQRYAPYSHTSRTKMDQFMNQEEWHENSLQEAEEMVLSTSQTPVP